MELNEYYKEFYDFVSNAQNIQRRLESFKDYRSYHFKDLYYIKKNLPKNEIRKVIDIGCCGTPYPTLFNLERIDYTGIDISQISLDRMKKIYPGEKIKWIVDDICRLDKIENSSIDLILATQVLEHLPNPDDALRATITKLRINGRIMIGTESALFVQKRHQLYLLKILIEFFLYLGSVYCVYGCEPLFLLNQEVHTFTDPKGIVRKVVTPHGYFHPKYFERIIKKYELPARIIFLRVTDSILPDVFFSRLGEKIYFKWIELKSKIPLIQYLGSQLFVIIEKIA